MTSKTKVTNSIKEAFNNSFLNNALSAFFYLLVTIAMFTFPKIVGYLKQIDLQYDTCIMNALEAGNYNELFIWLLLLTIGFMSVIIFLYKSALTIWLMTGYELELMFKKAVKELITILKLLIVTAVIEAIPYIGGEITQQHYTYQILFAKGFETKNYLAIFWLMFFEGASLTCMAIAAFRTVKVFVYLIFKRTITFSKKNKLENEQANADVRHIWSETMQSINDIDKEE